MRRVPRPMVGGGQVWGSGRSPAAAPRFPSGPRLKSCWLRVAFVWRQADHSHGGFASSDLLTPWKWREPCSAAPHLTRLTFLNRNRSEEHTSELQSLRHLVCRLLL